MGMITNTVMGVDPAYRRSGWAVLDGTGERPSLIDRGTIAPTGKDVASGLLSIGHELRSVVERWTPELVVLEQPGYWIFRADSNRRSIELTTMVRGVMVAVCASCETAVCAVDFQEARCAIFGTTVSKAGVRTALTRGRFLAEAPNLSNRDHDIADAIVMALYGIGVGNH
jgi:Holliday junction resolvasome RuvABC endonuclease subunit